jgi:GntR family histidine utilization transcriptional repressor
MVAIRAEVAGRSMSLPSLYSQIMAEIETRILSGEWPPGHKIPFEYELTARYHCSRMTVSKALSQLASAGLIERRRKAGTFVSRPHGQSAVLQIHDVGAEVASLGLSYAFETLLLRRRRATRADRERIAVNVDARVLAVRVRHDAEGRPFCYEDRLINLAVVPDAAGEDFFDVSPGPWLVARVPWTIAEHRIRAASAAGPIAAALRLTVGAPCLVVERRTWLGDEPVTQVSLSYCGADHELVARFTPNQTQSEPAGARQNATPR